jgi:hypothetical protein
MTHTQLMNVGLLYTPVSIYQMTRGALVRECLFFYSHPPSISEILSTFPPSSVS